MTRTKVNASGTAACTSSWGVWIFAAVLNLLLGWELLLGWGATEWMLASSWYRYSVIFYNLAMPGNLAVIIVVAFDISVIWRVVKLRWAPRANLDGMQ